MKRKFIMLILSVAVTLALIPTLYAFADDEQAQNGTPVLVQEDGEDQEDPMDNDVEEDADEGEEDIEVELPKINLKSPVTQVRESQLEAPCTYTLIARVGEKVIDPAMVTWTSDNEAVATVSPEGVVTVLSVGKANFTAAMTDGTARNGYAKVFVFAEKSKNTLEPKGKSGDHKKHK